MDNESRNSGWMFLAGIAVGAAAVWYMNTENGKRLRKESMDTINSISDQAKEGAQHIIDTSKQYAQDVINNGKKMAEKYNDAVEEKLEKAKS